MPPTGAPDESALAESSVDVGLLVSFGVELLSSVLGAGLTPPLPSNPPRLDVCPDAASVVAGANDETSVVFTGVVVVEAAEPFEGLPLGATESCSVLGEEDVQATPAATQAAESSTDEETNETNDFILWIQSAKARRNLTVFGR